MKTSGFEGAAAGERSWVLGELRMGTAQNAISRLAGLARRRSLVLVAAFSCWLVSMVLAGFFLSSWSNEENLPPGRVFAAELLAGWNRASGGQETVPGVAQGGGGGGGEDPVVGFPYSVQVVMWLVCFLAGGELVGRYVACRDEEQQSKADFLRGVPGNMVFGQRSQVLVRIRQRALQSDPDRNYFLPRLLAGASEQFQRTGSVGQANAYFNASMDLYQHEIDLNYSVLRYLLWLLPALGFIGTVLGIALALGSAGELFAAMELPTGVVDNQSGNRLAGVHGMRALVARLGIAFHTTLLALLQAAGLMLFMHLVQAREEKALNEAGKYCLDKLIGRFQ